jgi:hypothetical protein
MMDGYVPDTPVDGSIPIIREGNVKIDRRGFTMLHPQSRFQSDKMFQQFIINYNHPTPIPPPPIYETESIITEGDKVLLSYILLTVVMGSIMVLIRHALRIITYSDLV